MAELKEDKLIVKDSIVKKGAKDGWEIIKIVWLFLKEELTLWFSSSSTNSSSSLITAIVSIESPN